MNYFKIKILILTLVISAVPILLSAQKSESEVKIEEKLIDASKEKLLGNYDKSIDILREAKKLNRNNDAIAYQLGVVYNLNDDPETAIKMFEDAIRIDPVNQWYHKHLAAIYQETGNFGKGVETYQTLINMEPLNPANYYRKAYFQVLDNEVGQALETYDFMEQKFGFNEKIARRKHSLYLGSGNLKKAAHEFIKLIEQHPGNVQYRLALAEFYSAHDEQKKSLKIYKDIIIIDPTNYKAKLALAGNYNPKKNNEANYLNSLEDLFNKKDIDIDLKVSKLFPIIEEVSKSGNMELANKALVLSEILERVHAGDAKGYAVSGDFLYFSNQIKPALLKYKKTLDLNKNNFIVWENVMSIEWELGQIESLINTTESALDLFPNKAMVYYMNALAEGANGNNSQGLNMLRQAKMMTGKDLPMRFKILILEGDLYCKEGKKDRASSAYEKAKSLNPSMKVEKKCN